MPRVFVQWERMEGEPASWYSRFWEYCKMGVKRNVLAVQNKEIRDAAERKFAETGIKVEARTKSAASSHWFDHSKKWRWAERADAWDRDQILAERERMADDLRQTRRKHRDYGKILQSVGLKKISAIQMDEVSAANASAMIQDGIKVELTALGAPESIVEQRTKVSVIGEFTEQELDDEIAAIERRIFHAEAAGQAPDGLGPTEGAEGPDQEDRPGGIPPAGSDAPGAVEATGPNVSA